MARKVKRRFLVSAIALSLPALLLFGAAFYFVQPTVDQLVRGENSRVTMGYREHAERLAKARDGLGQTQPLDESRRSFRSSTRIDGKPWGYDRLENGSVRVWLVDRPVVRFLDVTPIVSQDYSTAVWSAVAFVLLVVLALTAFGIWSMYRLDRDRDDFIDATAHDLATPLAILRLGMGRNPQRDKQVLERMTRLVENLKAFLRLGGRRPQPESRTIDLRRLYDEAYELFRYDYEDEDSEHPGVALEAPTRVPARGDETLTTQIIWNLLGNDLKYAFPDGPVRARLFVRDGMAVFELADEGKGMSPYALKHCFDRYFRERTVMESGKGGFGIGLCTALEAARSMGGELTVRPNSPHGCVFTLALPAASKQI